MQRLTEKFDCKGALYSATVKIYSNLLAQSPTEKKSTVKFYCKTLLYHSTEKSYSKTLLYVCAVKLYLKILL